MESSGSAAPKEKQPTKIGDVKFINQFYYHGVPNLPKFCEPYQQSWFRNFPQHYYRLWDDASFTIFLKTMYRSLWATYHLLPTPEQKTYFAQYLLLFHFGGIVPHIDVEYAHGDTREILDRSGAIMFRSGSLKIQHLMELEKFEVDFTLTKKEKKEMVWLSSRVLASEARHPFWMFVCSAIAKQTRYKKEDFFGLDSLVSFTAGDGLLSIVYHKNKQVFSDLKILEPSFKSQASIYFKEIGWKIQEKLEIASKTLENGEIGKYRATAEQIKERKKSFWEKKKKTAKFTLADRQDFSTVHQQKIQYIVAISVAFIILLIFFVALFRTPKPSKNRTNRV